MDWETWMLWNNYRLEQEAKEAEENRQLQEQESERDYFAQFDND